MNYHIYIEIGFGDCQKANVWWAGIIRIKSISIQRRTQSLQLGHNPRGCLVNWWFEFLEGTRQVYIEIVIYYLYMYNQQQNKWYPQRCLLAHFKATLYFNVANVLAHNNVSICYYVQVNSLRLKSSVAWKWASIQLRGYHLICCWWCIQPPQYWSLIFHRYKDLCNFV